MKASELMIGDWVHVEAHRGFNAQNVKVETIPDNDSDNEYWHHYGHIGAWLEGGDNDFRDVEARHLQPIPLTAEILEKNGFKKIQIYGEKQDDIFQCYDSEIIIEVGIYDPNFILIHYRYETPDGIHSRELSSIVKVDGGKLYLHELQHALRLCGIEKEIEL